MNRTTGRGAGPRPPRGDREAASRIRTRSSELDFDRMDVSITVPELRRYLADLTRNLSRAPFPLDATASIPRPAPARAVLSPLWRHPSSSPAGDQAPASIKDARCLNRTCWIEKCHRSGERAAANLRTEHPTSFWLSSRGPFRRDPASRRGGGVLPSHADEKSERRRGGTACDAGGGAQMGRLVWIKPRFPPRPMVQHQPDNPARAPRSLKPTLPSARTSSQSAGEAHEPQDRPHSGAHHGGASRVRRQDCSFQTVAALARFSGRI